MENHMTPPYFLADPPPPPPRHLNYERSFTTIVIASPGLHVIFNIESGQNVNRPVRTRGNIGDDAALLRRIDANIVLFDNMW